jgi:NAD+ synthase
MNDTNKYTPQKRTIDDVCGQPKGSFQKFLQTIELENKQSEERRSERIRKHINMKNLSNEIVQWIKDYATKNNRKSLVVGVSGGVDSALVSTLCAMTGLPTHCVVMPCQTKTDQTDRGNKHIEWLRSKFDNVYYECVDLTNTFEAFQRVTTTCYHNKLGYANSKSRLRMVTLYQIATATNGLVVGTGNKVEDFGVGFFTKYGDGGVDISPIGNLLKSEVRTMCRALGVLPELSEAVPTDGLWDDTRTDEDQIGATYDELEWAMEFFESNDPGDIHLWGGEVTTRQREVLAIYDKWHNAGAHKLAPIPVFVRNA